MDTNKTSIDSTVRGSPTRSLTGLLIVPITTLAISCFGYGLNQKTYFDKVDAKVATIQDAKIYAQNNKDAAGTALAGLLFGSLIVAAAYAPEKKNYTK